MDDLTKHIAGHLRRALHTYVEGDDTRAAELTDDELCDIARAIIPLVEADMRERCAKVADKVNYFYGDEPPGWMRDRIAAAIRALPTGGGDA